MILGVHATLAAFAAVLLWRSLSQSWLDQVMADAASREVIQLAMPVASVAGSVLAIASGQLTSRPRNALVLDAAAFAALLLTFFAFSLGSFGRDLMGSLFVLAVVTRFWPATYLLMSCRSWPRLIA